MSIEMSPSLSEPKPIIKLWTPNTIGTLTFFLGFPVGITLATINWIKMGMTRKAIPHIPIGIAGIVALTLLPDNFARIVGLGLSWGYIVFFRSQMKDDIESLGGFNAQNAHWFSATAIGLGEWGIFLVVLIAIQLVQSFGPGSPSYYYTQGARYFDKGDYKNAIANFDRAIELDPNDIISYNDRGLSYIYLGDYDRGMADCNKAIELDPKYANAYINRGIAYGYKGDYDQAFNDFNKAIELTPKDPYPYYNRAVTFERIGDYENALADYDRAIELDFDYVGAYINRGLLHRSLGQTGQAINDLEKVLEITTDSNLRQQVERDLKQLKGQ